ncbi:tetratricopeptide repeat protein [Nonomuraea fuscirosea]|uniref:tetratricopeptide repeat protein n=1 Tax=Nonomuraea fuscirosea TaxID=1291556 RepID=UPI00389B1E1F
MNRHELSRSVTTESGPEPKTVQSQAEQEYRAVLAIVLEVLGGRHPITLAVRNGIAYVLTEQARYGEAERAYRKVLAVRREVLGEHHPDTLTVRNGVAYVLAEQGRHGEAEQEFREILAVRREVLGEHHPRTLTTRRSLEAVQQVRDEDLGLRPLWEL